MLNLSASTRLLSVIFLVSALAVIVLGCSSGGDEPESGTSAPAAPAPTSAPPAAPAATEPPAMVAAAPTPEPEPTATQVAATPTEAPEPTPEPTPEPEFSAAPDLVMTGGWVNSEPFTLEAMQAEGKVVLIDFWTYTCINCIRTLPYIREWHDKYADHGLVILGVHTPEFEFEHDYDNVVEAVGKFGLEYPIVQDNDFGTWRAFSNRYWPAKYLIDHTGQIRYSHFGEGAYDETELEIRSLLLEAGYDIEHISPDTDPGPIISPSASAPGRDVGNSQTRELYAGYDRNISTWMSQSAPPYVAHPEYYEASHKQIEYTDPGDHLNHFLYLQGLWLNTDESLVHARSTADFEDYVALKFFGTSVNVVMSPDTVEEDYNVRVFLDDAPVPEDRAGRDIMYDDVGNSYVSVDESRMYFLVDQSLFEGGELRLTSNSPGFEVFAFTFGAYEGGEPGRDS